MITQDISIFDLIGLLGNLIIFLLAIYTAWENLINKKYSRIGFDAWTLLLLRLFLSPKKMAIIYKDKKRIKTFGFAMLLIIIGSVPIMITDFSQMVWPSLK